VDTNYVKIFDTTLRDGEQSPGATLTSNEKLEIARMLARMGVDVIEAGFPAASPDDLEGVRRIAVEVGNPLIGDGEFSRKVPVICGLARATKSDIDLAWKAIQQAARPCIHTFLATSPIHIQYKLRMEPEDVVSLEEVVMTLLTRRTVYGLETGIDTTQISRVSRMVSNYTGIPVQPNKAIVGANAFAHEAGIHQDGMLKNQMTYEIMRPETVGLNRSRLVLGKHSGRHALKVRLSEMGFDLSQAELDQAFERFKELADKKKTVTDIDLEALIEDQTYQSQDLYVLDGLQVACGTMGLPTATVRLIDPQGELHVQASIGTGPVDATYKAIDAVMGVPNTLLEFNIHAITEGIDAIGEVTVRLMAENSSIPQRTSPQNGHTRARTFGGYGADTDIIVASARAYLAALNKLLIATGKFYRSTEIIGELTPA